MVFGGRCLNVREVCMDFEPCFKVHNLVSVYPKRHERHVVVSLYRLVTI